MFGKERGKAVAAVVIVTPERWKQVVIEETGLCGEVRRNLKHFVRDRGGPRPRVKLAVDTQINCWRRRRRFLFCCPWSAAVEKTGEENARMRSIGEFFARTVVKEEGTSDIYVVRRKKSVWFGGARV